MYKTLNLISNLRIPSIIFLYIRLCCYVGIYIPRIYVIEYKEVHHELWVRYMVLIIVAVKQYVGLLYNAFEFDKEL